VLFLGRTFGCNPRIKRAALNQYFYESQMEIMDLKVEEMRGTVFLAYTIAKVIAKECVPPSKASYEKSMLVEALSKVLP